MTSIIERLLPATWRGIPFGVVEIRNRIGRRTALHEYPYRDKVWVEDLGNGPRIFGVAGFIAGPLAEVQHAAFLLAVSKDDTGTLTHPSLGIFEGRIVSFSSALRRDSLGCYDIEFEFVESADPVFPTAEGDTGGMISLGSLNVFSAAGTWFGSALGLIGLAAAVVSIAPAVAAGWASIPQALAQDAGAIVGSVVGLGAAFGVYANGSGKPAPAGSTQASLLAEADTARAGVQVAAGAVVTAAAGGDGPTIAAAVQALPAALRAAVADPADQVRVLTSLAAYAPDLPTAGDAFGLAQAAARDALAALCLWSTLAEMARAARAYQPGSYDDAVALRDAVVAQIATGELRAGELGADDVFSALVQAGFTEDEAIKFLAWRHT